MQNRQNEKKYFVYLIYGYLGQNGIKYILLKRLREYFLGGEIHG